jgi:ferric-dicitrate binding protein FerR (iron transport regulator)
MSWPSGAKWSGISGTAVWLAAALLAAGGSAGAAAPGAKVTAVTGSAGAAGVPLERQSALADGDSLRTGEDGACSILVDGDAVLELCQATTLRLGHRDGRSDGPRVLELRAGEIRVLAEPRAAGRRIEIHTPAAIATVLGSVVYVAVDARGVTTIASAESKVRVESSRRLGRAMTLTAGQQITVRPGAPLPRNAEIWDPEDSAADGCLVDFRAIAFDASRAPGDGNALEKIAAQDVTDALPQVSAESERRWESPVRDLWIDPKLHPIYNEIDTGAVPPPAR